MFHHLAWTREKLQCWHDATIGDSPLALDDARTLPTSPTSPTSNGRRPVRRSPRSTSFKRRSPVASSPLKATIVEETAISTQDMAASFLQYCATCEKQILNPTYSILYCSEACRHKDSCKPLALAAAAMSPAITPPSSTPSSPRPIRPPPMPTGAVSVSTPLMKISADLHNDTSDLDPSEWKPKLRRRGESEAFRYLSQFHRSASGLATSDTHDGNPAPSHLFAHCSTTSITSMAAPSLSLSRTPTTTSSSLSIDAEYDFSTRPLQSRQNPIYSASAGTTKGVDLVMPFVAPPPLARSLPRQTEDHEYDKRAVAKMSTSAGASLGVMFGREEQK